MACVLGLLFTSWPGTMVVPCRGADSDFNSVDAGEDLPDMNYVRAQAEAGRPRHQTQLADFYLALADFTNAVHWYGRAADQNYVPAQLSLAGCLLSGRGSERNPSAASKWLRRAADVIESGSTTNNPTALVRPAPAPTNAPPILTAPATSMTTAPVVHSLPPRVPMVPTNSLPVQRINTLLAAEPALQETPAVLRPYPDSR